MSEPPAEPTDGRAGPASSEPARGRPRPGRPTIRAGSSWPGPSPTRSGAGPRRRSKKRYQRPARVDPVRSGARPDDRDPKTLGDALEKLVDTKGWSTDLSVRALLARWPALVGPTNAAHSWPESYAETVLTVRTESTVWATSLRTMAPQLVAKLNEAARRRHGHPGQGARAAGPVLEEGPAVGPRRARSAGHVRLSRDSPTARSDGPPRGRPGPPH